LARGGWLACAGAIALCHAANAQAPLPAAPPDQTPPASATQTPAGPYISLGGGAGFNTSLDAHYSAGLGATSDKWNLDTGAAGEVSLGWAFGNGLRLEGEADLLTNKVSGISGEPVPVRAGGLESKFGGFVNLMYDFRLGLPVVPYLGVGIGGQDIEHGSFNISTPGFVFPEPIRGHQVVGDFAYQGIAGLAYPIGWVPGLSLTAEYRFLGLLDPQPSFRFDSFAAGDPSAVGTGNVRFSSDYNQSVMLGLRYVLFAPRGAGNPDLAPVIPPVPQAAASRTYLVFFDWDRADLTARGRQIVAEAASASAHVQTTRIEVNGYTDLSGSADYNKRLSVRRGESVEAELVRDGVSRDEITVTGYGENNPLVTTAPGVREPQNRRVEIILH
jgi:outer membrane protein OmpA-like peptidoglycan-associated protein